jgi:hypothetical protein
MLYALTWKNPAICPHSTVTTLPLDCVIYTMADQKYPGQNFYGETTNNVKVTIKQDISQHLLTLYT